MGLRLPGERSPRPLWRQQGAAELAIASWRSSFCGTGAHQTDHLAIATARASSMSAEAIGQKIESCPMPCARWRPANIPVRRPEATRPWQHVLRAFGGYLLLAEQLLKAGRSTPALLISAQPWGQPQCARPGGRGPGHWPGSWLDLSDPHAVHETGRLHLQIDKLTTSLAGSPAGPSLLQWSNVCPGIGLYMKGLVPSHPACKICRGIWAYADACELTARPSTVSSSCMPRCLQTIVAPSSMPSALRSRRLSALEIAALPR